MKKQFSRQKMKHKWLQAASQVVRKTAWNNQYPLQKMICYRGINLALGEGSSNIIYGYIEPPMFIHVQAFSSPPLKAFFLRSSCPTDWISVLGTSKSWHILMNPEVLWITKIYKNKHILLHVNKIYMILDQY